MDLSRGYAEQLDKNDELAGFRERFLISDPELIYMDGNSLGRLALVTQQRVQQAVDKEWGEGLIRGWNQNWWGAPQRAGDKIGQLIGAAPGQTLVCDSTSVDLFKLIMAALELRPGRSRIVTDDMNFPSDLYVMQGCARLAGEHEVVTLHSLDGILPDLSALDAALDQSISLLALSHVTFKSGYLYDMKSVTERAHAAGALVLWDLCHSAGVVPTQLDEWGVDLAVGCTYKYLNGGPGSPAFLYVRKELQDQARSPIWGWWGQRSPFAFDLEYAPAPGANRFLAGSIPILSLLAMEAALDLPLEAGLERIRRKSEALTAYAVGLVAQALIPLGYTLGSPRDPDRRGSHISVRHPEAYRINRALIESLNVIPDFRAPDNIRLGFAPLYTTFTEVWEAVDRLRRAVEAGLYKEFGDERLEVT